MAAQSACRQAMVLRPLAPVLICRFGALALAQRL